MGNTRFTRRSPHRALLQVRTLVVLLTVALLTAGTTRAQTISADKTDVIDGEVVRITWSHPPTSVRGPDELEQLSSLFRRNPVSSGG